MNLLPCGHRGGHDTPVLSTCQRSVNHCGEDFQLWPSVRQLCPDNSLVEFDRFLIVHVSLESLIEPASRAVFAQDPATGAADIATDEMMRHFGHQALPQAAASRRCQQVDGLELALEALGVQFEGALKAAISETNDAVFMDDRCVYGAMRISFRTDDHVVPLFRTHVDGEVAKRSSRRQTSVYLARNRHVHFGDRGRVGDVGLSDDVPRHRVSAGSGPIDSVLRIRIRPVAG